MVAVRSVVDVVVVEVVSVLVMGATLRHVG